MAREENELAEQKGHDTRNLITRAVSISTNTESGRWGAGTRLTQSL